MIGKLNPEKSALIVGAGISGLLAGFRLKRAGFKVKIIEKSNRAGGLIQTHVSSFGVAESAAHSLLASPAVLRLAKDLHLNLIEVNSTSKARYIFNKGKLKRIPLSINGIKDLVWKTLTAKSSSNTNLEAWTLHHLGKEALENLVSPAVQGIFAVHPSELEIDIAFPGLLASSGKTLFQHLFSKPKKKKSKLMSFENGMESLIKELQMELKNEIEYNIKSFSLEEQASHHKNIILCTPAHVTSELLKTLDPKLSEALKAQRYAPLVSITGFISKVSIKKFKSGVGVLFPRNENIRCLGVLFNSSAFSKRSFSPHLESFTFMFGGSQDPQALELTETQMTELCIDTLDRCFGLNSGARFEHFEIYKWEQAIPIYNKDLKKVWTTAQSGWCQKPGHLLFSNYTRQVSIRGLIENSESFEIN